MTNQFPRLNFSFLTLKRVYKIISFSDNSVRGAASSGKEVSFPLDELKIGREVKMPVYTKLP